MSEKKRPDKGNILVNEPVRNGDVESDEEFLERANLRYFWYRQQAQKTDADRIRERQNAHGYREDIELEGGRVGAPRYIDILEKRLGRVVTDADLPDGLYVRYQQHERLHARPLKAKWRVELEDHFGG